MGCCGNDSKKCDSNNAKDNTVHERVQDYYGNVLKSSQDLKTSACCNATPPDPIIRRALADLPHEVISKFYGCGCPVPLGIEGLDVLDLGSGSGTDCYVAARLVGENGSVTGVDMTPAQVDVATTHSQAYTEKLGYKSNNMRFVVGYLENLTGAGIPAESQDLVISNCVINLVPDKKRVLQEVYRVLKPGGEFFFSDVYCDRRLPTELMGDDILLGECIAGALYKEDFVRFCHAVNFADPRVVSTKKIDIHDAAMRAKLGNATFYSITYRLFKLDDLESKCEDYGQAARYKGTIEGHPHGFSLDDGHYFEKGRFALVCGNTASMLSKTRLAKHFEVIGDRSVHYGLHPCNTAVKAPAEEEAPASGGCC
eukprot:Rmarinus@m.544